jgi:hypothetical protein
VLGTAAEIRNGASKTTSEIDDENWIEKQFLSSQAFHGTPDGRVQEITAAEQFEPRILEYFVPVTQESYLLYSAQITTNSGTEQLNAD